MIISKSRRRRQSSKRKHSGSKRNTSKRRSRKRTSKRRSRKRTSKRRSRKQRGGAGIIKNIKLVHRRRNNLTGGVSSDADAAWAAAAPPPSYDPAPEEVSEVESDNTTVNDYIKSLQSHVTMKKGAEFSDDSPAIIKKIIYKYITEYYEDKKINYTHLAKLLSTFGLINELGIRGIFVIVQQSKIICFRTFLNKDKHTLKHTMLTNIKKENTEKWNNLFGQALTSYKSTRPEVALSPEHTIMLDRCMVRPFTSSVDKPHGNLLTYYNMFSEYLKNTDRHAKWVVRGQENKIDKMFFFNIYDHPIILKDMLDTNFLLSSDTIKDIYSDLPLPHHDSWIFNNTAKGGLMINNHYKDSTEIYKALKNSARLKGGKSLNGRTYKLMMNGIRKKHHTTPFFTQKDTQTYPIPDTLDIKQLDDRDKKIVFRGSLTGCYQDDPAINKRLKFYFDIQKLTDPDKAIFDYEITGVNNMVQIENRLYDYTLTNDDDISHPIFDETIVPLKKSIIERKAREITDIATNVNMDSGRQMGKFTDLYIRNDRLMFNYKYTISIDGYVSAWRLPYELIAGTVVFVVTNVLSWIYPFLKHGVNCFIVNSVDEIIPIYERLEFDENNYYEISKNAHLLGRRLLNTNTIFDSITTSLEQIPSILSNEPFTHIY